MLDSWTIVSTLMRIQSAFEQAGVRFGLLRLNRECSATLDRPDFDGSAGAPGGLILILRPRRPIPPLAALERIFWLRFANRTPAISCFREASHTGLKLQDEVKARLKTPVLTGAAWKQTQKLGDARLALKSRRNVVFGKLSSNDRIDVDDRDRDMLPAQQFASPQSSLTDNQATSSRTNGLAAFPCRIVRERRDRRQRLEPARDRRFSQLGGPKRSPVKSPRTINSK